MIPLEKKALDSVLIFKVGVHNLAVDISEVESIMEMPVITSIPMLPDFIRGTFPFNGKIASVVDLRKKLELAEEVVNKAVIVVTQINESIFAFQVDSVDTLAQYDEFDLDGAKTLVPGIKICSSENYGIILLTSFEKLLDMEESELANIEGNSLEQESVNSEKVLADSSNDSLADAHVCVYTDEQDKESVDVVVDDRNLESDMPGDATNVSTISVLTEEAESVELENDDGINLDASNDDRIIESMPSLLSSPVSENEATKPESVQTDLLEYAHGLLDVAEESRTKNTEEDSSISSGISVDGFAKPDGEIDSKHEPLSTTLDPVAAIVPVINNDLDSDSDFDSGLDSGLDSSASLVDENIAASNPDGVRLGEEFEKAIPDPTTTTPLELDFSHHQDLVIDHPSEESTISVKRDDISRKDDLVSTKFEPDKETHLVANDNNEKFSVNSAPKSAKKSNIILHIALIVIVTSVALVGYSYIFSDEGKENLVNKGVTSANLDEQDTPHQAAAAIAEVANARTTSTHDKGSMRVLQIEAPKYTISIDRPINPAMEDNLEKKIIQLETKKIKNEKASTAQLFKNETLSSGDRLVQHAVVKGDTLWKIAGKYLNDPYRYPELAKLSDIRNPDLIYPGDIVTFWKKM